ncbi:unnamed protein product [Peronospora destructor]|uniref:Uncharacterized protein n=1 Tax=Peronospora destructor TaxID=86335 RepID=A0AAV0UC55_9STRA|nr:unnamed protein product [Peronospora destructor]
MSDDALQQQQPALFMMPMFSSYDAVAATSTGGSFYGFSNDFKHVCFRGDGSGGCNSFRRGCYNCCRVCSGASSSTSGGDVSLSYQSASVESMGFTSPFGASDDQIIKEENEDVERPVKMAKKKQRGTGKPRGRPRTRPRPGEIIRRAKPLPPVPASYSVMYNYSLSNLAQRSVELNADGTMANTITTTISDEAQDEDRLVPLSASLLSGEHE